MTDCDWEYHINYPTREIFLTNSKNDEFSFFSDLEKPPVVILFGWAGSKDQHLAKYSFIYENQG